MTERSRWASEDRALDCGRTNYLCETGDPLGPAPPDQTGYEIVFSEVRR